MENLEEQIDEVLSSITPREKRVLQLRFGLVDGHSRTLEEVGKELYVTSGRIQHLVAKALRKLRHPSCSAKLKDFLTSKPKRERTPSENLVRAIFGE